MNISKFSSPQVLSGAVTLGAGKTQTVTLDSMASRSQRWLRLEELSVILYNNGNPSSLTSANPLGSFVNIRARAYRQDLMLNYLPVWLMGPMVHQDAEYMPISVATDGVNFYGPLETYRWKFAKPFFLPPGAAFVIQLQRNSSTFDLALAVNVVGEVAVRATQVSEKEALEAINRGRNDSGLNGTGNPIPFMAAYTPSTYPNKSNNLDLANPFLVPLQIQRMTGRTLGSTCPFGIDYQQRATVKLTDTRTVICDVTPMTTIFPATSLAWTHTRILQPNEYVTAELGTSNSSAASPQVAIVGYRNEALS